MNKAHLLVVCILAASFTGCLDDLLDDNEKPLAKIENKKDFYEITCRNDELKLNGTGYDSDGIVWSYEWKSNIDGIIGTEQNVSISKLSTGNHTISFSVKDDKEKSSDAVVVKLNVKNYLCGSYTMIASEDGDGVWEIGMVHASPGLGMSNISWNLLDNNGTLVKSGQGSDLTNDSAGISYSTCRDNGGIYKLCPGGFFYFYPGEGILSEFESIRDFKFYLTYNPTGERLGYSIGLQS